VSSRPSRTYIPNTNIVRTTFTTPRGVFEVVDFAPRFRQYERHFRPNLLLRRVRRLSGEPHARIRCRPTYDYGRVTPEVRRRSNHLSYAIRGQQLRLTAVPGRFQKEVVRSALALKLHIYQDTGAVTAATTTSIPEWPGSGRNQRGVCHQPLAQ